MYENFHVTDHWTREDLHCRWTANVVAIATRHADAVDIRFEVNGRPVWIAMPAVAWVAEKQRSGHVITDRLAAQAAGRYLKQAVENGYDNGREMYTMSVPEVLEQVDAVMAERDAIGRRRARQPCRIAPCLSRSMPDAAQLGVDDRPAAVPTKGHAEAHRGTRHEVERAGLAARAEVGQVDPAARRPPRQSRHGPTH